MKFNRFLAVLTAAFVVMTGSAQAGLMVFTDEAAWTNAVNGIQVEDFEASPVGALSAGTTDLGKLSVTIASNPYDSIGVFSGGAINGSNEFIGYLRNGENTALDFADFGSFTAFAGDWRSTTTGDDLTITVAGELVKFSDYLTGAGNGFLGVVSDMAFSEVVFGVEAATSFGEYFQLDNVRFANTAASVAAPSALLLLGLGLLVMGLVIHRMKKRRA